MGLVATIPHCQYAEIRDNRMGLGSAILPCPHVEIRNNHVFGLNHSSLSISRYQG
jgi:hypothetical protein